MPSPGAKLRALIDTSMPLEDFSQELGVQIESEKVETLAGALLQAFGELPASGATIELCGLRFTVEDLEHNRITRVLVERLPVPVATVEGEAASAESAALPPAGDGSDQPPVDQSNRKEGL